MREIDIHVAASAPGQADQTPPRRLEVIIEDKGCWNAKVDTDIEDQLVETYLNQTNGQAGIYVVFCFDCIATRSKRPCASCRHRSAADLRGFLEGRASNLTTEDRLVIAIVIEAGISGTQAT